MIVKGIEYEDEDAELFSDGSVHDATLKHDTTIQGLPCAGGRSVVYFPSGRLRLAWLARPTIISAVNCAAAIIYLNENGTLLNASLAAEYPLGSAVLPVGTRVTFDENGNLLEYSQQLSTDQLIHGFLCAQTFQVWRYPDGRPSVVALAAPTLVNGQEYPRGSQLFFDENGQVLHSQMVDLDSGVLYKQRVFGVYEAA